MSLNSLHVPTLRNYAKFYETVRGDLDLAQRGAVLLLSRTLSPKP